MGVASFCVRHCKKLGRSLKKRGQRTAAKTQDLVQRCFDPQYNEISRRWKQGYCFPSGLMGMDDPLVRARWDDLRRYSAIDDETLVKEWLVEVRGYTMVTYDGLFSLAGQVRYCEQTNLPGVYVETGCHRGGAAAIMAKASLHYGGKPRPVHVFDSFEGLPQPDAEKDVDEWIPDEWKIPLEMHQGKMVATGSLAGASEEDVRTVFKKLGFPLDYLHTHKGWFCDTLPVIAPQLEHIAILRLDGDLYASTMDALTYLYPKVVVGGFVVIDDYNVTGARNAVTDYLKGLSRVPYICRADGAVAYFIKQSDEVPRA
jgi:O-methyltransferase